MNKRTKDIEANAHHHVILKMANFLINRNVDYFLKTTFKKWLFTRFFFMFKERANVFKN